MDPQPHILPEIARAALSIAGWWFLFYKLHRPPTMLRRLLLLGAFAAGYTFWILIPLSDTGNVILWAALILLFALLAGDWRNSFFTALYYIGMEAAVDTIRYFCIMYLFGKTPRGYTAAYYVQFNLQYLFVLGWAFYYYWIMKDRSARLPLRFWIMTVIPPFATTVLLTRYADVARPLLAGGTNIFLEGTLIGLFLLVFNLFTFYMYFKLSLMYEAQVFANEVADVPPVYTGEQGLSAAFISKYDITKREREIVEAVLRGKSNKEIAEALFLSQKTVEVHLSHIYRKTGAPGRYALYTLIHFSPAPPSGP
jgi:DNA-binding CsgD family transcriptional regulator